MKQKNNTTPQISVIIPAYNEEKILAKCLEAVTNQDFPKQHYQVIVVDNNSTDKTNQIAKQFTPYVFKEKTQGIVATRNNGYQHAKGIIIANLDADCIVPSNWLTKISANFKKDDHIVAITGPYRTDTDNILNTILTAYLNTYQKNFNHCPGYWAGNFAIKKSALDHINGYDLTYPHVDQLSLISRLKKQGKVLIDPELIVHSSDRRTKGRRLKFFVEIISYFLNQITKKLLDKNIETWKPIR